MSDEAPKVVRLHQPNNETEDTVSSRVHLTQAVDDSIRAMQEAGVNPTGMVYILLDDAGKYRTCWDTQLSKLPANACIGFALAALVAKMGD